MIYTIPANFSGAKFAARYGLAAFPGLGRPLQFWVDAAGALHVRDDIVLPNPPIFDTNDSPAVVQRREAVKVVDSSSGDAKLIRAVAAVMFDETNLHALKINSILDAIDAATTLVDLKARIAAIPDYPQRTLAQAIAAIKNKLNTGGAD